MTPPTHTQDCETPILVDVFAVWCGPCQLMAPELDKVAEKFGDKLRVLKIDADDEDEVASSLQIRGLPTVRSLTTNPILDP